MTSEPRTSKRIILKLNQFILKLSHVILKLSQECQVILKLDRFILKLSHFILKLCHVILKPNHGILKPNPFILKPRRQKLRVEDGETTTPEWGLVVASHCSYSSSQLLYSTISTIATNYNSIRICNIKTIS